MTATPSTIQLRVLAASTGVCYPISLHPSDLNVATLRQRLAAAVPIGDQILLLGPPYKVPRDTTLRSEEVLAALRLGDEEDGYSFNTPHNRRSNSDESSVRSNQSVPRRCTLNTTEKTGAKRLFLFSKRALMVDDAPDPPPCVLEPRMLTLPTEPDPSPVSSLSPSTLASPLHQALEVYERRFMLNLCRGRALADGADLRIASCQKCVAEQSVMARSLRAAVSNLSDHRNNASRTMAEFSTDFQSKTVRHAETLSGFENLLTSLAEERLHPSLQAVAKRSGRMMETLLDTVPVERERAWGSQCQMSHQRLLTLYAELERSFSQVGNPSSWEEESRGDLQAEEQIMKLSTDVEEGGMELRKRQVERLDRLTKYHGDVVGVVMNAIGGGSAAMMDRSTTSTVSASSMSAQSAFATLEDMSQSSTDVLPSMEKDDEALSQLMITIGHAKTHAMKRMQFRLRQISVAQSTIQRVLSGLNVLRDALNQQCENMTHLDHVTRLRSSYHDFLAELRRRRAYGHAVTSTMEVMVERMASMRLDEVRSREKFLRSSGRHLMPPFYEIFAPTLASPPPIFAPQMPATLEMDTLPDVGPVVDRTEERKGESIEECTSNITLSSDVGAGGGDGTEANAAAGGKSEGGESADSDPQGEATGGVSSVSSSASAAEGTKVRSMEGDDRPTSKQDHHATATDAQQDLIVSADENTDDEVMTSYDPTTGTATTSNERRIAALAERRTLEYENAVLRQTVERLGGKPVKSYLDEAKTYEVEQARKEEQKEVQQALEQVVTIQREKEALKLRIAELEKKVAKTKLKAKEAENALLKVKRRSSPDKPSTDTRISHASFDVGDVGLFMPTGHGRLGTRTYLAFHSNCPHRYLSSDSVEGTPDYVLGRIVYQEEHVAGPKTSDANPYSLHPGTKFWVLTVEVLKIP